MTSVLRDHLSPMKVMPYALLLGRAREGMGGGGDVTVARLVEDMRRWQSSFDAMTSLVDFYGFRGKRDRTRKGRAVEYIVVIPARDSKAREAEFRLTAEPDFPLATATQTVVEPTPPTEAPTADHAPVTLRLTGTVPSDSWNRVGMKLLPKLGSRRSEPKVSVDLSVRVDANAAGPLKAELQQVLDDLGLGASMTVRKENE